MTKLIKSSNKRKTKGNILPNGAAGAVFFGPNNITLDENGRDITLSRGKRKHINLMGSFQHDYSTGTYGLRQFAIEPIKSIVTSRDDGL